MPPYVGMILFRISDSCQVEHRRVTKVTATRVQLDNSFLHTRNTEYLQTDVGHILFESKSDALRAFACVKRNEIAELERKLDAALKAIDWATSNLES